MNYTFLSHIDYKDLQKRIKFFIYTLKNSAPEGMDVFVKKEIVEAVTKFIDNPCYETAIKLMEADPKLIPEVLTDKSLEKISKAIFKSSLDCATYWKEHLNYSTEKEKQEKWIYVLFEYIYFFMHMANRIAFGKLGNERRIKLQEKLGPLVIEPTIESLFGHWPKNFKEGIKCEFYEKLNRAEIEYSNCKELLSKDNPFSDKALFPKLAKNVAELSGHPNNPEIIMQIIEQAVDIWKNINLEELVDAVGQEI